MTCLGLSLKELQLSVDIYFPSPWSSEPGAAPCLNWRLPTDYILRKALLWSVLLSFIPCLLLGFPHTPFPSLITDRPNRPIRERGRTQAGKDWASLAGQKCS